MLEIAVIGATGAVGQEFVIALNKHKWFELTQVAASERSAGINDNHAELLNVQRKGRGWKGFIAPLPNCTTTGMAITLKPILDKFGIEKVFMTSMQALSGAGRSPGVIALDIMDNVIPYIPKED